MYSMKAILLFLKISLILCDIKDVQIKKGSINEVMKEHIMSATLAYFEVDSDLNNVSRRVTNNLNAKYGGSWICLIGKNLGDVHFEYEEDFHLWFQHNSIQFMVFKAKTVFPIDYNIIEARKPETNLTFIHNDLNQNMTNSMVQIVKNSVANLNSLESISQDITYQFENKYKKKYICSIGTFANIEKIKNFAENSTILLFRIENLNFTIFQMKNYSPNEVIV